MPKADDLIIARSLSDSDSRSFLAHLLINDNMVLSCDTHPEPCLIAIQVFTPRGTPQFERHSRYDCSWRRPLLILDRQGPQEPVSAPL